VTVHLPSISEAEFRARWDRLQQRMRARAVDLLVVFGDDRAVFGPANVRYLTDFPVHFEPVMVLLGTGGAPVLVTGPETVGHAQLVAAAGRCVVISELCVPGIVYPGLVAVPLAEVIAGLGRPAPRAATVDGDQFPVGLWRTVRPLLGADEPISFDEEITELRARKSDEELAVLRAAFAVTEAGMRAVIGACRPGAYEYEIAATGEYAMRSRGAEGTAIDTIIASGQANSAPIVGRTGLRRVRSGDWVAVTIACKFAGYGAPMGRLITVGPPAEQIQQVSKVAHEAQEIAIAALRVGATGDEVDAGARAHLNSSGYESAYGIAHSVGNQEFGAPFLMPGGQRPVGEREVYSIDVGLFGGEWGGFRTEDTFIVSADGLEPVTSVPRGLIEVPG
jgi:Xaa-Pro aminopeptidase